MVSSRFWQHCLVFHTSHDEVTGPEQTLTERPSCSFSMEQSWTSKAEAFTIEPPNQRLSTAPNTYEIYGSAVDSLFMRWGRKCQIVLLPLNELMARRMMFWWQQLLQCLQIIVVSRNLWSRQTGQVFVCLWSKLNCRF